MQSVFGADAEEAVSVDGVSEDGKSDAVSEEYDELDEKDSDGD